MANLFRYFNGSPEVIGLTAMMTIRYPLFWHIAWRHAPGHGSKI